MLRYVRKPAAMAILAVVTATLGNVLLPCVARAEPGVAEATAQGVIRLRSTHGFTDTVTRIEAAVKANEIRFFGEIDQANLAAGAKIKLRPSKLLLFGNPPLGIQLLTANPLAGLDWPVRMLVTEDAAGQVWIAYTDFSFIAQRYGITDRAAVIAMATKVSALVSGTAAAPRLLQPALCPAADKRAGLLVYCDGVG